MNNIEIQDLLTADVAITRLYEKLEGIPEDHKLFSDSKAILYGLILARVYLTEYLTHMVRGTEPMDAAMATVRGDLNVKPWTVDDLQKEARGALH